MAIATRRIASMEGRSITVSMEYDDVTLDISKLIVVNNSAKYNAHITVKMPDGTRLQAVNARKGTTAEKTIPRTVSERLRMSVYARRDGRDWLDGLRISGGTSLG